MDDERVVPGLTDPKYIAEHLARYNFAIPFCKGKKVLDAACGVGYGSRLLSVVAKSVKGWDYSYLAVSFAKQNYPDKKIEYQIADLDEIEIPNGIDTVVSFETIEHLKNPDKFLSQVFEKADSFIFSIPLRCPNAYHLHVYNSFDEVKKLMGKRNINWFGQKLFEGDTKISQPATNKHAYIIGIWKK